MATHDRCCATDLCYCWEAVNNYGWEGRAANGEVRRPADADVQMLLSGIRAAGKDLEYCKKPKFKGHIGVFAYICILRTCFFSSLLRIICGTWSMLSDIVVCI